MDARYRLGHRPGRRRRTRVFIVFVISLAIIGAATALVVFDLRKNRAQETTTGIQEVVQAGEESISKLTIDEPAFSMELPGDWKEVKSVSTVSEHSITWKATAKNEDKRFLTLYVDTIPQTKALNRFLPVTAQGSSLSVGDISENCATFTQGGTLNAIQAQSLKETPAKWQKIDFICDLPRVTDNEVGTGSADGINTIIVNGPTQTHKYFFLYTDHDIQPNYEIFYNALRSFRAK